MWKHGVTAALALSVGLLLGRRLPQGAGSERQKVPALKDAAPVEMRISAMAPPVARPIMTAESASAGKSAGDMLGLLQQLRALQKRGVINFQVPMFEHGKDRHLTKAAKEFLQISEAEGAEVDGAMDVARAKIGAIEAESAVVSQEVGTDKVTASVPSFPEQGGKIFDAVRQGIYAALGTERGEALEQLGGLESQMGDFGVRSREIEVTRSMEKNRTIFSFKDSSKTMGLDPSSGKWMPMGTSSSSGQYIGRASAVEMLGPLGEKMLPKHW
jgi:hypothetical protein